MEEFWPEWELDAAQSSTTLYISDAITECFSDDKKCPAHEEMQILGSRLYNRKSSKIFFKKYNEGTR